jgi:hypothetical protein
VGPKTANLLDRLLPGRRAVDRSERPRELGARRHRLQQPVIGPILIPTHGISGLITSSLLIDIFTISFASRSIFKRSSMRIWLLS